MKKVIVVTSSPRRGDNTEMLARRFAEGAEAAGNEVKLVAVRDLGLKFCTGCLFCQSHDRCVLDDGMNALYPEMQQADVLVFATPVYYYSVCGQLKTFLDRLNPLFPRENRFREIYLLAAGAEDEDGLERGALSDIQGWADCFEGVRIAGVLCAKGVQDRGDVAKTGYPERAYALGRDV